jgi:phospholipase/carboxylesterase
MKPATLLHQVRLPERSAATHPTVVMLHGRGADEEDLLGLSSFLDDRLLILSPRAPFPFPNGGYTWYDADAVGSADPATFSESYEKLVSFVRDAFSNYPIDPARLFLFGFSMGSVMAFALGLTKPQLFRGVVANSGYIPETSKLDFRWDELAGVEFLITHGTEDSIVPVMLGRRADKLLNARHARYTYREYPMGHQISDESLADVSAWIRQRIDT